MYENFFDTFQNILFWHIIYKLYNANWNRKKGRLSCHSKRIWSSSVP